MKKQKGITLIALVITIIVMLILVGVSVTVALNGGLFSTAKQATDKTQTAIDAEKTLDNGRVKVDGIWYDSIEDYINKKPSENQTEGPTEAGDTEVTLPEGWTVAETKPEGWSNNVTAVTDGTNTIPLPNGFEISSEDGESTVSTGLVLKDGTNEFVWVPVTNAASYTEDSFGPLTGTYSGSGAAYDSQETLDYFYGTDYYDYDDFTYETDKTKVEENIQTYGGFYVGRYETTIDGTTIGVQQGKTVLTVGTLLKEGTNSTSNDEYHYRWWGIYKAQKDMYANNSSVGSLMISVKQWDEIMTFTGYGDTIRPIDSYTTKPDLSGSAYKTDSSAYDVTKNIYDLAGNVKEFTLKAYDNFFRVSCGGYWLLDTVSASYSAGYTLYESGPYSR